MIVSWMTTNRCNLNCQHCYQDAGIQKGEELSTNEALQMIDDIYRAGFRIMIFSGGEPLLRKDIFQLVSHANQVGLRPVFGTNGTLLTPDMVAQLRRSGAAVMGISLDSLNEAAHNRFRGHPDAYRLTMEGMENCRRAGLPFQLHTTVMDWNQNELMKLMEFANQAGAVAHYIFFLIPVGRGVIIEETALEILQYEQALHNIMEKSKSLPIVVKPTCAPQFTRVAQQMEVPTRFSRGCLAGLSYCIVSPVGKVRPCAYMVEEAGDIRQESFDSIWTNSPLFQTLRSQDYKGSCGSCVYRSICGGCRARAGYYHQGDILAEDSYCAHGQGLLPLERQVGIDA